MTNAPQNTIFFFWFSVKTLESATLNFYHFFQVYDIDSISFWNSKDLNYFSTPFVSETQACFTCLKPGNHSRLQ